jgi:hypothetical protein
LLILRRATHENEWFMIQKNLDSSGRQIASNCLKR